MDVLQTVSAALQEILNDDLNDLARDCELVVRQREFTGQTILLMIVVTLLHKPDATWADFHLTAARLGLQVSQTAIEKRFAAGQPLVDFFREVLQRALQKTIAAAPSDVALLHKFSAVLIGDASTINLPAELADLFRGCGSGHDASCAALKLQVLWDLKTGELVELLVEPGRASDTNSPITKTHTAPGSLHVFDLGYFDLSRFAKVASDDQKFISRLLHGTSTFTPKGEPLDLLTFLRQQTDDLVDLEILLGSAARLPCRLVAIRVPEEVANRRRQKAREKAATKGKEPSAEYLELLGWSLFVTNCDATELTWRAVVVLYRARWQIELLFKLWKSHNRLAKHRPGARALEVLALFYAKLLAVVLQHWVLVATTWSNDRRSLPKAARALADMVKEILMVLRDLPALEAALLRLREMIANLGGTTDRNKEPSHAQLIENPDLLDWLCH